ncbi:Flp family type IVb pilin [Vibrio harveyi]|uniref:Flp family type IVb pilin n=1 Tax=Vibrio harveyi TaxID=669 RepID=UPI0036F41481
MLLKISCTISNIINEFKLDKRGVTAVEYAIIAVAMSSIILLVFKNGTLSNTLTEAMRQISSSMTSAGSTTPG